MTLPEDEGRPWGEDEDEASWIGELMGCRGG